MKISAPAKVNLGLDVVRRRPDGYHEVDMIMQMVDLCDTVTLEKTEEPGIRLSMSCPGVPENEENIAWRAARSLFDTCGTPEMGVYIHIEKHIPIAAGMAGGSTDCAAVLMGINELFSLGLSQKELELKGKALGADVPYCIRRGTARARGIGEKLTALPPVKAFPILIAKPGIGVSTKAVYQGLSLSDETVHPDIDALENAVRQGDLERMAPLMANLLETVTIPMHPVIAELKSIMKEAGAKVSLMSGSGPTVFGLFADEEAMKDAEEAVARSGLAEQIHGTRLLS